MTSKHCIYDNPRFHRREMWIDGRLTAFITENLMYSKEPSPFKIQADKDFKPGTIWGDKEAIFEEDTVICVWPDNTICERTEVGEYSHMSDDYSVVRVKLNENGTYVDYEGKIYEH